MNTLIPQRLDVPRPAGISRHRGKAAAAALLGLVLSAAAAASGLDLTAYRGKVVYVDFWASWCGPCRQSFPWLDEVSREYAAKNLVVIGVNVDHDRDRAERFLTDTPAEFPIIYDPRGEIAAAFKVNGMPSAVLIDRSGRVRFQHTGFSPKSKEQYEDDLRKLLDEPTP